MAYIVAIWMEGKRVLIICQPRRKSISEHKEPYTELSVHQWERKKKQKQNSCYAIFFFFLFPQQFSIGIPEPPKPNILYHVHTYLVSVPWASVAFMTLRTIQRLTIRLDSFMKLCNNNTHTYRKLLKCWSSVGNYKGPHISTFRTSVLVLIVKHCTTTAIQNWHFQIMHTKIVHS